MDIKQLGKSMEHANIQQHSNSAHNRFGEDPKVSQVNAPVDELTLGNKGQEDFGTYKIDTKKLAQIKQEFHKNTESFKVMVRSMIEKQGGNVSEILKALANGEEVTITVDAETKQSAQEAISEDGYWGVNKTSERILEFAKTISGGDKSKIDTLIGAFKEGFEAAKEAFGGELPEISQQTYDKVMEGFEAWKAE
ncbi:MAG: hypothetical protein K8R73_05830 [Clostridiales bacterium]|nr:hypothetical protein [Clostridiales bacterium]